MPSACWTTFQANDVNLNPETRRVSSSCWNSWRLIFSLPHCDCSVLPISLQGPSRRRELIGDYVTELCRLTAHHHFEAKTDFCGLWNMRTRTCCWQRQVARDIKVPWDSSKRRTATEVFRTSWNSAQCYRCGRTNHKASNCKFKEAICHRFGTTLPTPILPTKNQIVPFCLLN